ncbi:MAG TPA: C25 family cysteine peptidase, partial [Salinivirgaceae bacterium]|nr:C25 family cysteine peptidase [Salinivirgaceae bacterium]
DQKYGILVGNCCQSSQFNNECFAETITRAANKGAIGYIGGTNSTYWNEDYWWATGYGTVVQNPVVTNFGPGAYDALFHEYLPNDNVYSTTQSQIPTAGCLAVEESNSTRKQYYWEIYHLMGDPTLNAYIGPMPEMTPDYLTTLPLGLNSFTMSNIPPKAYVALTDNGVIKFAGYSDATGSIEVTFDGFTVPTTADIVITAPFHRPFIGTLDIIPSNSPFVVYFGSTISDTQGNNNGMLDFDETVTLKVNLKNVGTVDATNVVAKLRSDNPYITIIDSVANCGNIDAETEYLVEDAFVIKTAKEIPDQTKVNFTIYATDETNGDNDPWVTTFSLIANAPQLTSLKYQIVEIEGNGNGRIDAGETISVTVPIKNIGHALGYPMTAILSANIIVVDVENEVDELNALAPEEVGNFVFTITTGENIPVGTPLDLTIHVSSDIFSFVASQTFSVGLSVEDFENGNFDSYGWVQGGAMPWTIVNNGAYEGTYCAKSGAISHSQQTSMSVTIDVTTAGQISFYRKVSSENNYDKLHFKINQEIKGTWSGSQSWEQFSYDVPLGNHTFTWEYAKDYSVSSGEDCAWVDYIVFPGSAGIPNKPPYFLETFIPDAHCGEEYSADLFAIDPDGDQISFVAESLPIWMTLRDLGDGTALLGGTPTNETASPDEQIVVSANDGLFKATRVKDIKVHGCTSIAENEFSSGLSIYPNPSSGNSTIEYTLLQGGRVAIDILSINGQVLKTVLNQPMTSGDHQTPISFEGLASGVYMVRLVTGEVTQSTYVVVK